MQILFDYNINYQSDCNNNSKLPFSVFGMSQQGISHVGNSLGNQDSAYVYIGKNVLIGCVADGCTGGTNISGGSYNQVGAHVTSYLACRIARKLILKDRFPINQFRNRFELNLLNSYRKISNVLNPWQFERAIVLANLLSSTFILFIITSEDYLILGCGDGEVHFNRKRRDMVEEGGKYFANNLLTRMNTVVSESNLIVPVRIIQEGKIGDLNSILISTDGFIDNDVREVEAFNSFFFDIENGTYRKGFNDLKMQFREKVVDEIIEKKDGRIWPLDDATFISVKRLTH